MPVSPHWQGPDCRRVQAHGPARAASDEFTFGCAPHPRANFLLAGQLPPPEPVAFGALCDSTATGCAKRALGGPRSRH